MSQNVFDNDVFFEKYKALRKNAKSYNDLIEQPKMKLMLPELTNKSVLDLGCGYGINCMDFVNRGAKKVVGVDISQKMLDVAQSENKDECIEYLRLGIEDIDKIELKFDLIYSSMAFHYISDFDDLVKKLYDSLNPDGILLFSQEHPLVTAPLDGAKWIKDENGIKISAPISNYSEVGQRKVNWLIDDVTKYHRSFSYIMNVLIKSGFSISKVVEPIPTEQALNIAPDMYDELHRPTSILIRTQKG